MSVLIPAYNRVHTLREAIASVLSGSYSNIEILVSDDCSPTDLGPVVAEFRDGRLVYRRNATNLGVAGNMTAAIRATSGPYLTVLNDDDSWEPDFLSQLVRALEAHPDAAVAFCDHFIVDAAGRIDVAESDANSRRWGRDLLTEGLYVPFYEIAMIRRSIPVAMGAVFRRSAIGSTPLPREAGPAYDAWLAYRACKTGLGAYYVPKRLTHYRVHHEMQSSVGGLALRIGMAHVFNQAVDDPNLMAVRPHLRRATRRANYSAGAGLLRDGRRAEARYYFWRALSTSPMPRAIVGLVLAYLPLSVTRLVLRMSIAGSTTDAKAQARPRD